MKKGMIFRPFDLKTGTICIDFAYFGLESRAWFFRERGECMNVFVVSIPSE